MRVAIYDRVSTDKQSPDNQSVALRELAERLGWTVTHEFTDIETGKKSARERSQLRLMLDAASRREFDVLLFWAFDRLSREGTLATLQYLKELDSYGVAWRSHQERYLDSAGEFRDVLISFIATMAKQEVARRSERIKAGLYNPDKPGYSRRGKKLGRSRVADHEATPQCLYMRRRREHATSPVGSKKS